MSNEAQSLVDVLHRLEGRSDAFGVDDAHDAVEAYAKAHPDRLLEEDKAVKAELVVLGLFAEQPQEISPWGTHFGPTMVTRKGEYPPLSAVTPDMVAYWKSRAQTCAHPRLRARYADAAWDLEPKVADGRCDYQMARIALDAYVDDCDRLGIEIYQIQGQERALYLALKLGDKPCVAKVRDAIIAFQKKVADPDKPRCICFHFDILYDQRKKLELSVEQIKDMIAGMERQLADWSDPSSKCFDPLRARDLGQRLVKHYKTANSPVDTKRIVQTYAKALFHMTGQANGMLAHHWLEELHRDHLNAGLRAEADALVVDIKKAGERMAGEMRPVSTSISISNDEMERFCQEITEGDKEAATSRIVSMFTPDSETLRQEMHKQAAKYPLMSIMPVTIADKFTRARTGSLQDDKSGRLVMHMHQHLAFESVFLRQALDRLVSRYKLIADHLVELMYRSELFEEDRKALLEIGIRLYLAGEHASCAHVLIPQIEHLFRRLLGTLGGVTVSLDNETKTYREKDLGSILRDPLMEQFWKQATDKDVALYLRVVLTDQRAMNVRNRVCHGLCEPDWFTPQVTDRLLHILMLLSHLRLEKRAAASDTNRRKLGDEEDQERNQND